MHPLYGALHVRIWQRELHAVLWLHIGILMRLLAAKFRKYRMTFILITVSVWNDLTDPVFDGVLLAGFNSRVNTFLLT